jgi:hypothetical protein
MTNPYVVLKIPDQGKGMGSLRTSWVHHPRRISRVVEEQAIVG